MSALILSHDILDIDASPGFNAFQSKGRQDLRNLRDEAVSSGAHVYLVLWRSGEWVLLGVNVTAGDRHWRSEELVPRLQVLTEVFEVMRKRSKAGDFLQWLELGAKPALH